MGRRPIQESTYLSEDESEQLEQTADVSDMSKAEVLREGLHRQLQAMELSPTTQCQQMGCDDVGTERLELSNGRVYHLCEDHAHMNPDGTPVGGYDPNDPEKFDGVDA